MVELRPITENNFIDAFNLKLSPGQEQYVSHPVRSLAQAYVYKNQCQPFGTSNIVVLTCNKAIPIAKKLYEKKDFSATGAGDENETELALTLQQHKSSPYGFCILKLFIITKNRLIFVSLLLLLIYSAFG